MNVHVHVCVLGLSPTMTTLLKDLEVKAAAVQHNEMTSCPVISDVLLTTDDHISDAPPLQQLKPDCNVELQRSGVVAPPLTARNAQNPTVERNTHRGSSEELTVKGNTLVPRSAADHASVHTAASPSQPDTTQSRRLRPDQLHRISYVQNVVDNPAPTGGMTATAPKRQNVESQMTRTCEQDSDDDIDKAAGVCAVLVNNDDDDDDDDDDNASHNASATAAVTAGDNLGFESSTSPCCEALPPATSCVF